MMADELGASAKTARRAALLHDIGKAVSHEVEGPHALVGGDLARRHGEPEAVAHAMEAHHNEVEPQTIEAVIVQSADALSGARPGARGESLEQYVKRLRDLEQIADAPRGRREGLRDAGGSRDPRHGRRRTASTTTARCCCRARSPARSSASSSTRARSRSRSSASRGRSSTPSSGPSTVVEPWHRVAAATPCRCRRNPRAVPWHVRRACDDTDSPIAAVAVALARRHGRGPPPCRTARPRGVLWRTTPPRSGQSFGRDRAAANSDGRFARRLRPQLGSAASRGDPHAAA